MSKYPVKLHDTNVDLVSNFMEFVNPLNQAFVIQAITTLAENVIKQKDELLKQENAFVSMESWVQCAEDWKECINIRDGKQ